MHLHSALHLKAALVSIEDYERLEDTEKLTADILERRKGKLLDVDALWQEAQADREARDDQALGR